MPSIPVTSEGKHNMSAEVQGLEARLPELRAAIAEAREKGDLRENAEYHAAREELGHLQARIGELKSKLANAVVIDESRIDKDSVGFGAIVTLEDTGDGEVEDWYLVGEGEDDPLENRILTTSPMGQAMIGHHVGEEVSVNAPAGVLTYIIKAIRYG